MSHEIRFRVFDKKSGKIFPVTDMYRINSTGIMSRIRIIGMAVTQGNSYRASTDLLPRSRTILMQFTGLKDKNGVEIYEGDVVKDTHFFDKVGTIIFTGGAWYINPAQGGYMLLGGDKDNGYEVIGNIYENPELLK